MKNFFVLALFLLCSAFSFSQSYYETSWISGEVKYTALVVFYEEDEAFVRVKYYTNGSDRVSGYNCTYKTFTKSDGTTGRYLDGNDAYMVQGPSNASYSADNFYLEENNGTYTAYTADDNAFEGGDFTQTMKPMLYWIKLNPEALTRGYLNDFIDEDEDLFRLLLYLNKGELSFPVETNAVTVLAHGMDENPIWVTVMDKNYNAPFSEQKIKKSTEFPGQWIKQEWDNGLNISTFDYDESNDQFVVLMSKGSNLQPQAWNKTDSFPQDWVREKWDEGYQITSMTYGKGNWYLAMNKNTGYTYQRWKTSKELPRDWIIDNWNENYAITSATYGNGLWALTMSSGSNLGAQTWKTDSTYPVEWIQERADKGYSITTVTYGDGMWLIVMSKNDTLTTNKSTTQIDEIPFTWILENSTNN
ncbi:hypothetical protein [Flagellimonas sp. GZD32]|uniref:DUF7477 domain-containing protein n=1 Tax=Flagellimonas cixiensis TaxID=3228750 RepID=UPI0035C9409F